MEIKSKVYFILFFSLRRAICFCQILAWLWLEFITPAHPPEGLGCGEPSVRVRLTGILTLSSEERTS